MKYMVQDYLMGGYNKTMNAKELIYGFNSTMAFKVNGGDFLWGNNFALGSAVTPVFNDFKIGAMTEQQISLYPGSIDNELTGIVRWQNGLVELNRKV